MKDHEKRSEHRGVQRFISEYRRQTPIKDPLILKVKHPSLSNHND